MHITCTLSFFQFISMTSINLSLCFRGLFCAVFALHFLDTSHLYSFFSPHKKGRNTVQNSTWVKHQWNVQDIK